MTLNINNNSVTLPGNQGVTNLNLTKAFGTAFKNVSHSSSPATALVKVLSSAIGAIKSLASHIIKNRFATQSKRSTTSIGNLKENAIPKAPQQIKASTSEAKPSISLSQAQEKADAAVASILDNKDKSVEKKLSELSSLSYKHNPKDLSNEKTNKIVNFILTFDNSKIKPTPKTQTDKMQILNSLDLSKIKVEDYNKEECSNLLKLMNSTAWWPKNHDSVNTLMNGLRKAIHQQNNNLQTATPKPNNENSKPHEYWWKPFNVEKF